jgi:signal transduction histidine kinase/ligand-binding sensor domain-containing protein/DNA-binding response OmpR family regulator
LQSSFLFAQTENYRVEPIPKTTDLSNTPITCVLQDSEGFMWFGTRRGLYRYDGVDYKAFRHNPYDPGSISSDAIVSIAEDSANILWIATQQGLDCLDRYYERINRIIDTVLITPIRDMLDDNKGNLWLGTHLAGLAKFDKKTGKISIESTNDPTDTKRRRDMHGLLIDRDGCVWFKYELTNLCRYDPASGSIEDIITAPFLLKNLYKDQSGRLWITSGRGLYMFNESIKSFERQLSQIRDSNRLNSDRVHSITEDRTGNFWITTSDGVHKYSPQLKQLYHWPYPNWYGFSYEDNDGIIWTFNQDGMFKLRKEPENFTVFGPDPATAHLNYGIYAVNEDSILYSYGGSYHAYNRRTGTTKKYNVSGALCMYEDSGGIFWIGTENGLYRRIESVDHTVEHIAYYHIPGDSSSLPGNYVHAIFEDSAGRLWIACQFASPCYFDRENDSFIHLVDKPGSPYQSILKPFIVHETDEKALIACSEGVYKIIPPFTRISDHAIVASDIIEIVPRKPFQNRTAQIYVSHQDCRGTIWLGDANMGLFKWVDDSLPGKDSKGEWTLYTTMDGLAGNTVMKIEEDLRGNLWIGTTTGLSRFNPSSGTFTNFYGGDGGLPTNGFHKSSARIPSGEIFLGSGAGLVHFHPDSITLNEKIPPIRITSFKVNNQEVIPGEKSVLSRSILFTDAVKLSYSQNTLSISFAVLNYIEPERNQHKYMLEGLEDDWVFSGLRNNVTYANLKPGRYTFRATGSNNDGVWNNEGASLAIRVMAPPWRTGWAYVLYGLILAGIVILYRRYLLNRAQLHAELELERIEKEKVRELDQMKTRFFANISHEFRTPLTLITGPVNDLLKLLGQTDKRIFNLLGMMRRNTQRLQQLINELLELSKLETGNMKLEVSEGDLSGYLRSLATSFLSLAEKKRIQYKIDIDEEPGRYFYDRDKVEKIVTNLISNALKFTQEGDLVFVKVNYLHASNNGSVKQIRIVVSDTGPGIPVEERNKIFDRFHQVTSYEGRYTEGTGIGLALVKELVDLYRGLIDLESEVGEGSTFTVILPVSKELFSEDEIVPVHTESEEIPLMYADPQSDKTDKTVTDQIEPGETPGERPLILVVEDNEDLRKYIAQNLVTKYQIIEAKDGRSGLQRAIDHIPDLVISDLMMPEMDGIEMCERLKLDYRTSHIPLIMLTAKADKVSKLDSYEKGADDYILKPFDAEELQSRVNNLIEQRNRLRERYRQEFLSEPGTIKSLPELSDNFLVKVCDIVKSNLSDSEYSVEQFCQDMGLSQPQLYRKLMALTGHSPSEFIRNTRLRTAAEMFQHGETNVSTVLYAVGFNTPSHFSRSFRELYGVNPSDYIGKTQTNPD